MKGQRFRLVIAAIVVAAAGVAVVVRLTSGGEELPDALGAVRGSLARTVEAGTAQTGMSVRIENLPLEIGQVDLTGEGGVRFADGATDLTLRLSPGLAEFSGGEAGDVRLVDDGEQAFVLPVGADRWRPIAPEVRRTDDGGFDLLVGTDPTAGLAFVTNAATAADRDGSDKVRGEVATRYEVTLDPDEVDDDERGAPIARLLEAVGFDEVFAYVWVDDQHGHTVRVRYDADLARLTGGGPFGAGGRFVSEFELFDFGSPVEIELPPPDARGGEEVDARELERMLGGLGL